MTQARHNFPMGFLWGTATSSHQVEGDNRRNDWHEWEAEPGRIQEGHVSAKACDWWGGRWQEDLDRAAEAGQNSHRLSLEWSRLEPEPGKWDSKAERKYREMLEGARARELTPMVTLHHFTNPQWLMAQGGWLNPNVVEHFGSFASRAVEAFGDLNALWVTINEPNVYAYAAYASGEFPPGESDLRKAIEVMINMTRGHARAYHEIHEKQPNAQVGLAHHYRGMKPASSINSLHRMMVSLRSNSFNTGIPHACKDGVFRLPWRKVEIPEAKGSQDFFGLNYYTRELVAFDPRAYQELFGRGYFAAGADVSPTGFIANDPEGFWEALRWAHSYDLPIYVTENGVEDDKDDLRRRYLIQHIRVLWRAVNFNWRVKGYYHWSLVDNFEWERGWTQRFGLWELNPSTQERTKRPSADLYAAICRQGALTTDIVEQYAPELLPVIFPPAPVGDLPPDL
ncbi:MAG: glycoside hydrolase family 1 protein [Anaerolineales bacterium]